VATIRYRGRSTGFLYGWGTGLPSVLADPVTGAPVQLGTWNGESVVLANLDGSVARSTIGGPPAGDPYSFTVVVSPWESLV
jgi:hypothetical protein